MDEPNSEGQTNEAEDVVRPKVSKRRKPDVDHGQHASSLKLVKVTPEEQEE